MRKDKDIQGPENTNPGIDSRELAANVTELKPSVLPSLLAMVLLLDNCGGGGGPVVIPDLQTKTPNTFVPTETPRPTEKPAAEYKALALDITSLVEANPETISQEYKDLQAYSFSLAKEMPEFVRFTPRIWSLSVADDGPKIDENLILAQNQTTNEFYILAAVTGSGVEAKTTLLKEKVYAEVVMGENGNFESLSYYYLELDGTRKEFIGSNPETNGGYTYTMTDGNKVELDEVPIAIGGSEGPIGSKSLFSVVPQQENFYETLPKDAIINTQTGKIELNGETIYHYDGKWRVQPQLESGAPLEFSPLLPAVWSKEWTGKVGDLEIPIIIGLAEGVYNDITPPITSIKGVWMTQEGADAVADAFLRAAHYRYTKLMGNEISYEGYLEILKNEPHGGEVNLLITDNELDANGKAVRREALIDPRQGFSTIMTDKIDQEIGVKRDRINSVFFGVDGQGRLLMASDFFSHFDFTQKALVNKILINDYILVASTFNPIQDFAFLENKCMINGNSNANCGEPTYYPAQETGIFRILINKQELMVANSSFFIPWGIEK